MRGINHVHMRARFHFLAPILGLWLLCRANDMTAAGESRATVLWYAQPAAKWTEALPIGNQ